MSQRKNPELDAKHQAILRQMMQLQENKSCADCKGPSPRWASTNLGVFVCIACSGIHRKLGTHISQVRSITLDTWTPAQIAHFQKLGNAKAARYFEACIPPDFRRPHSGDSMLMERFIREKYEKKRFITVENGGLGGNAPTTSSRRGSSFEMNGSSSYSGNQATIGRRPVQLQGTTIYDQTSSRGRTSLPTSYGSRFGGGGMQANGGSGQIGGTFNSGRVIGTGRTKNAMQRASTLREIMNMGFPAQLASRAVEVSEGDLQRAVDWVLENSDAQNAFRPQPKKAVERAVERDLLDFGDPEPIPASLASPLSKVADTTSLVAQAGGTPVSAKTAQDNFTDFADFGAFESALPVSAHNASATMPATSPNPISKTGNGSLSGSIASLYAQRLPTVTSQVSSGSPQMAKIHPASNPYQFNTRSPTRLSPQLASQPFAKGPIGRPQSGTIPAFTWNMGNKPTSPVRKSPTLTSRLADAVTHDLAVKNNPTTLSPPPPPPMAEISISNTEDVPPPPNFPPPAKQDLPLPAGISSAPADGQITSQQGKTSAAVAEEVHKNVQNSENEAKEEPQEEEDPFAALSMLALSSASSKKKQSRKQAAAKATGTQKEDSIASSTHVESASAGINLDDLLG